MTQPTNTTKEQLPEDGLKVLTSLGYTMTYANGFYILEKDGVELARHKQDGIVFSRLSGYLSQQLHLKDQECQKRVEEAFNGFNELPDGWWFNLYRTVAGGWGYEIDEIEQTALTAKTLIELIEKIKSLTQQKDQHDRTTRD